MALQYGDWSIVRELGKGSFGTVYEIEKSELDRVCRAALKVISVRQEGADTDRICGQVEAVLQKIRLLSQEQGHTNLVDYQNYQVRSRADGEGWEILIQMELLTPLNQYVASHGMTRKDVVTLGISVCKALEACEKCEGVHPDIKPGNIFVSDQREFKLDAFDAADRCAQHGVGANPHWAPERYQGKAADGRSDLYSLGLVLYHLLNHNRGPFLPPYPQRIRYQDQEQSMIRWMRGDRLPSPGEERGKLAEIVLKACRFRPEERYLTAKEMRTELEAL